MKIRPLWQKMVYPFAGFALIIFGIIMMGFVALVPGFPFLIIGIPLAACIHPKLEQAVERYMQKIGHKIKDKWNRKTS